jgi:hypothetical protein
MALHPLPPKEPLPAPSTVAQTIGRIALAVLVVAFIVGFMLLVAGRFGMHDPAFMGG